MPAGEPAAQTSEPLASLAGRIELGGEVSANRLGFGAMRVPGVWEEPEDLQEAHRLLRRAIELGVNLIDTAEFYQSTDGAVKANALIREALHPYPDNLVIVTKVGARRGEDASWNPAQSPAELIQALPEEAPRG